jgi:hypothetical protein
MVDDSAYPSFALSLSLYSHPDLLCPLKLYKSREGKKHTAALANGTSKLPTEIPGRNKMSV